MVGWTDLPADLSDTTALARLAAYLPTDAPVVSSDLSRAVATADALGRRTRLPHDPDLREMHFGRWEMRGFAEVEAEDAARIRAFWESPGDINPPEGESWNALSGRVWAALDRLNGVAQDIIVVCHFGPIVAALQRAEELSPEAAFAHRIDNLSVTSLTFGPPPAVFRINHRP
jgi:broad specificity phosphatase PhoE